MIINKRNKKSVLLFEGFYPSNVLIYGIAKVALTTADIMNLKPVCLLPFSRHRSRFIKTFGTDHISLLSYLPQIVLRDIMLLTRVFFKINVSDLLNLEVNDCHLGKYIYDSILIRKKITTLTTLTIEYRLRILLEVAIFLSVEKVFRSNDIKVLVLGDNTYRHGLFLEIAKKHSVLCISPVNLNDFRLSKYVHKADYDFHCYQVSASDIASIRNKNIAIDQVKAYIKSRFSGDVEQHDVLNAFLNKNTLSVEEFKQKYGLIGTKKIVAISPHIFCDAPHGYPGTIFKDYHEWFIETCKILSQNVNVTVIVKEHPSAHLYGEEGKLDAIIEGEGLSVIRISSDENQLVVLNVADVMVTCGGTVGLEFATFGKPVILAAKPPYSGLGFTLEARSKREYAEHLLNAHLLQRIDEKGLDRAFLCAYLLWCNDDIDINKLEIGSQKILLGKTYDESILNADIKKYSVTALSEQYIYEVMSDFLKSDNRNGFNFK